MNSDSLRENLESALAKTVAEFEKCSQELSRLPGLQTDVGQLEMLYFHLRKRLAILKARQKESRND
jgi:hypothetical protein